MKSANNEGRHVCLLGTYVYKGEDSQYGKKDKKQTDASKVIWWSVKAQERFLEKVAHELHSEGQLQQKSSPSCSISSSTVPGYICCK